MEAQALPAGFFRAGRSFEDAPLFYPSRWHLLSPVITPFLSGARIRVAHGRDQSVRHVFLPVALLRPAGQGWVPGGNHV